MFTEIGRLRYLRLGYGCCYEITIVQWARKYVWTCMRGHANTPDESGVERGGGLAFVGFMM